MAPCEWVIDILQEWFFAWLAANPVYVWRGSYMGQDFNTVEFTQDAAWHELDLSGIVPANCKGVHLRWKGASNDLGTNIRLRAVGDTNTLHTCEMRPSVAGVTINAHCIVGLSADSKIEYYVLGVGWTLLQMNVRGWWTR